MNNKFAVVTGASTGIGRAIAIELSKQGVFVALVGRDTKKLLETKSLIHSNGEVIKCDLTKVDSVNALVAIIRQKTKKVDILVNVAGVWHGKDEVYAGKHFDSFSQEVILDTYSVGLIAPTLLIHALIPFMPAKSNIINISGTFESGAKGWLPYFVSKRALEDLTIGLSEELKDKEIQVNAISPSDTATESYKKYFPQYLPDAIEPEEIGKFVVKLCSSNETGKIYVVKKGQKPFDSFHF